VAAGQPGEAGRLLEQAARHSEQVRGPGDAGTWAAWDEYAAACLADGKAREAIGCCQRTLAGRERLCGPDHPGTLAARLRLADACLAAGKTKDAIAGCTRVVAGREQSLGVDHPDTLAARARLAAAYDAAGPMGAATASARLGKCPRPGEVRLVRPAGAARTIFIENGLEHDETGHPAVLRRVFKDVTVERAAEARRQEIEQQLQQAQKLEALGTLAGGVAHELNNTLVPVLALAKMTLKRLPEGSREQSNLRTILGAGEKARDLVHRIVAFARREMPTRAEVDLAALTRQALILLRASLPPSIVLEARIAPVPPLLGDPGQLPQIVINLVVHAVQATKDLPLILS